MISALLLLSVSTTHANEGLWRPEQLEDLQPELQELGIDGSIEDLTRLDAAPLGAIVGLDRCSGAFVSDTGLIATAFHCITEGLQFASRGQENLFSSGWYAQTPQDERWVGPTARARITVASDDVTSEVLAGTKRLDGPDKTAKIDDNIKTLVARCERGPGVRCMVATFGEGAEYQLIEQLELRDLRLVYSPPHSVGYFGGDADNWQWPRHSGDFAFLRAYGKDGEPAEHDASNEPYTPSAWLTVAERGPQPGDFAMVAGYPGRTYRWRSGAELAHAIDIAYPMRIATSEEVRSILEYYATRDLELAARVGPQILSLTNRIQYLQGNLEAFERTGYRDRKWELDTELGQWIASSPERTERYGTILDDLARLRGDTEATWVRDHVAGQMLRHTTMLSVASRLYKLAEESRKPDRQRESGYQNRDRPAIAAWLEQVDARYDYRVDRAVLRYFLLRAASLPEEQQIPELRLWLEAQGHSGNLEEQIDEEIRELYAATQLTVPDKRLALMETSPWFLTGNDDPWFELAAALRPFYDRLQETRDAREAAWHETRPRYIEAIQEYIPEGRPRTLPKTGEVAPGLVYPDANGTLRVSIGDVRGYTPRDGLLAVPRTRLEGILEKALLQDDPPPVDLIEAIEQARFGPYADDELGSVPVNFLTTIDTAPGNSGSPTLDSEGRFVGIIFDGNYEAIASDWAYDIDTTRSIHTDVTYMLWYLDAVAGAHGLLAEIGVEARFKPEEDAPAEADGRPE